MYLFLLRNITMKPTIQMIKTCNYVPVSTYVYMFTVHTESLYTISLESIYNLYIFTDSYAIIILSVRVYVFTMHTYIHNNVYTCAFINVIRIV